MVTILSIHGTITHIHHIHTQSTYPNIAQQFPNHLNKILKIVTNTHIDTYPIQPISNKYHIKFSKAWKTAPKNHTPNINITLPLPSAYTHIHPLKYHQQQCIYTDESFIPPSENSEGQIIGNTAGSGVYSPNNNIQIAEKLPRYPNILRAELNALLIAINTIQIIQTDTHIFTDSLNNIYLINNHIQHLNTTTQINYL